MTFKLYLLQFLGFTVQIIPIAILLFIPFHQSDFRRGISRKLCISIVIIGLICCGILFLLYIGSLYNNFSQLEPTQLQADTIFSASAIAVSIFYFYVINRNWLQKLLILVANIYYAAIIFSVANIVQIKIETSMHIIRWNAPYENGCCVFSFAVVTALTFPVMYHIMHQFHESLRFMEKHFVWRSGIFVIVEVILLILFIYSPMPISDPGYIWNLICYTCANLFAMFMFFDNIQAFHERKQAEDTLHMLQLKYHAIHNNIEEMKNFYHDMRHHFNVISTLNAEGKSEELNAYLKQYITVYEYIENNKICDYALIDTILKYYMEKCKREHIKVDTDIALNEDLGFDFMDMTVLLGNCLENAIEASMLLEERKRYIHIQIMKIKHAVLIVIENNCPAHKVVQGGEFISLETQHMKKDDKFHGFGIKSIQNIAQKYDGCAEYQQTNSTFTIRIILYIR